MAIPRTKTGWRWLIAQTATFDIATAGFTAIVGLTSAINYALAGREWLATTVAGATSIVLCLTIAKNTVALKQTKQKESTHELEGCLYTLHAALDPTAAKSPGRLRLAIHVPASRDSLEQVTEYIGDQPKKGRIGRKFPDNAGIIGECYRKNQHLHAKRLNDDYEAYVNELITDWNYTEERAKMLNPATMAWMAVPFFDPLTKRVEAVLYLDTRDRDFFTAQRQELVLAAVNGIAIFIGRRYS